MKLIITSVIAIIFVALGSIAGVALKPAVEVAASTTGESGDKAEGDYAADKKASDKKDAKKGDGYGSDRSSGDSAYY